MDRKEIEEMFFGFLWEEKPARIVYNTILRVVEKGSLDLMDVEQRKNCLR